MPKLFSLITILISINSWGQVSSLRNDINKIIDNKHLTIGVSVYDLSNGDTLTINGNEKFPMQSVFKFPIALSILSEVDKCRWGINEPIFISKQELHPNTWSPLRDTYLCKDIWLPLSEIIRYTVSQSDNNGCDILLNMLGGTVVVNNYLLDLGINGINLTHNEQQMHTSWDNQFDNYATPNSIIYLLKLFYDQKLLQTHTQSFLLRIMEDTSTGSIKNILPPEATVAHKTGSSGYNSAGVSAATNDIGLIRLPSGEHILYSIFITNSQETADVNYSIISEIGSLLYHLKY